MASEMQSPHLPLELVQLIFDHIHDSHRELPMFDGTFAPTRQELMSGEGIKIFDRFRLVCRAWHDIQRNFPGRPDFVILEDLKDTHWLVERRKHIQTLVLNIDTDNIAPEALRLQQLRFEDTTFGIKSVRSLRIESFREVDKCQAAATRVVRWAKPRTLRTLSLAGIGDDDWIGPWGNIFSWGSFVLDEISSTLRVLELSGPGALSFKLQTTIVGLPHLELLSLAEMSLAPGWDDARPAKMASLKDVRISILDGFQLFEETPPFLTQLFSDNAAQLTSISADGELIDFLDLVWRPAWIDAPLKTDLPNLLELHAPFDAFLPEDGGIEDPDDFDPLPEEEVARSLVRLEWIINLKAPNLEVLTIQDRPQWFARILSALDAPTPEGKPKPLKSLKDLRIRLKTPVEGEAVPSAAVVQFQKDLETRGVRSSFFATVRPMAASETDAPAAETVEEAGAP